ncbi:cystatin-A-like isoform X1 [Ptychodera flava]|uniref:cystatin-A-like isoform X1 n=1 Tax=Ptychodera flava TaxID=63121 RepID=UPI00396A4C93
MQMARLVFIVLLIFAEAFQPVSLQSLESMSQPATEEVQELLNKIQSEVEESVGLEFDVYVAKLYITQVVNRINYFVKVYIGNDEYIHVKFHKGFQMTDSMVTLIAVQDNKRKDDELIYF